MVKATDACRNRVGSNIKQNYPRGDTAKAIKSMFVTRDSRNLFMQFDLSQAELRGLGSFTRDPKLKHAYDQGLDLHSYTAANLFYGGDITKVEKPKRSISKTVNFATVGVAKTAK